MKIKSIDVKIIVRDDLISDLSVNMHVRNVYHTIITN